MHRLRISGPANADLHAILTASRVTWGADGARRYAATLTAAMSMIATAPSGPNTRDRSDLVAGLRCLHLRRARGLHGVSAPVHVIYFRAAANVVEVVRVLPERLDAAVQIRWAGRAAPTHATSAAVVAAVHCPRALVKRAVRRGMQMDLASGLDLETFIVTCIYGTSDKNEGISAFLEKRKAEFKGE